jgi:hypothetical protein
MVEQRKGIYKIYERCEVVRRKGGVDHIISFSHCCNVFITNNHVFRIEA